MPLNSMTRREMLASTALGGVWLGTSAWSLAREEAASYPSLKTIKELERDGWVVEYRKADVAREGFGLRGPSILPAERFVITPSIIESHFEARGRCRIVMPRFAHVCNQTALVSRVEVEAGDRLLKRGEYSIKPLITRPLGNRFWQVSLTVRQKVPVKIRVTGFVTNAATPSNWKETKPVLLKRAAEPNQFEKKYRIAPSPHWFKKPSEALQEEVAATIGSEKLARFPTLLHILGYVNKKAKLTKKGPRDPERFVKDAMEGPCGANSDYVNYAANIAGNPYLIFTEGFVAVPRQDYLGLHAWNMASSNGFFIADALNPELVFPEYPEYVATSVGANIGHPGGAQSATNGGWANGDYVNDYYVYFSFPPYGMHGKKLAQMEVPEGVQKLGDHVVRLRTRVNERKG
jgi:hypothetical protein